MSPRFDLAATMRQAWAIYRDARYECERRSLAQGFRKAALAADQLRAENLVAAQMALLTAEMAEPVHRAQFNVAAIEAARTTLYATLAA
jgi:hypothetical protein